MTSHMMNSPEHDYIQSYEQAVQQLGKTPEDKELQHQAVLSLARAGCLEFAISEFERYGLSDVRQHEDIMALDARLFKDRYLRASGNGALEYALESARKYDAAFQETSGYYAGINAATMALMANMSGDIIRQKALAIQQVLPEPENFSPETRYFIEATRAESYLLLGEPQKAKVALQTAFEHDPLNYAAHATTLKQFRMILNKMGNGVDWLSQFSSPKSIHFAGHIFGGSDMTDDKLAQLSDDETETLANAITDIIQKEDIGFGFGALAAGADILIAECLLAEGAELHLIFPTDIETFVFHSILPFGKSWMPRFDACLKNASSIKILSSSKKWPDASLNRFAAQVAMGQAVLRAQSLSALSGQLLLWDQETKTSFTSIHASDWRKTGNTQTILPFPAYKASATVRPSKPAENYSFLLLDARGSASVKCRTADRLAEAISGGQSQKDNQGFAVHLDVPENESAGVLSALMTNAHKNQILISEVAASLLAYTNENRFHTTYAGQIEMSKGAPIRAFSLFIND